MKKTGRYDTGRHSFPGQEGYDYAIWQRVTAAVAEFNRSLSFCVIFQDKRPAFFGNLVPQLIRLFFPAGCILITFSAQVIGGFRRLEICGVSSAFFHHFPEFLRIFQHGTGLEHIAVDGLTVMVCLKQRRTEPLEQRLLLDV